MQSHCSWQPFNVNAGVKGEAEGFCCLNNVQAIQGGDKLSPLHVMVANHHIPITYKGGGIEYIAINDFGGTEKHQATIN